MRYVNVLTAIVLIALMPVAGHAAPTASVPVVLDATPPTTSKTFSDAERMGIEDIIHDYLVNKHPEVMMEAMRELQKRDQASAESKSKEAIEKLKDKIYNNPNTQVGGNPKGDVTVVEFFDYQCGYCKLSEESILKLLKEDKGVKFLYKEFPILGPMSVTASKAAYASARQGKYIKFHDALMAKKDHLNEDGIYQTAKDVGLDVEKLKKDATDDATAKMVEDSVKLGTDVGVRGTPMFIIGDKVYPGALQYDQLKKAVDDARPAKK